MIKNEIFYLPKKEEQFSFSLYEHLSYLPLHKNNLFVFEKENAWLKLTLPQNLSCLYAYFQEETCAENFLHSLFQELSQTLSFLKEHKLPLSLLSLSAKGIFFEKKTKHFYFSLLPLFQNQPDPNLVRKEECLEWLFLSYPRHLYPLNENDFLDLLKLFETDFFQFLEEYFKKTKSLDNTPTSLIKEEKCESLNLKNFTQRKDTSPFKQRKYFFFKEHFLKKSMLFFAQLCLFFSFFQSIGLFIKHKNFSIFLENNHFFFPLLCLLSFLFLLLNHQRKKISKPDAETSETQKTATLFYLKLKEKESEEFILLTREGSILSNDFSQKEESTHFFYTFAESTTAQSLFIKLHKEKLQCQNIGNRVLVLYNEHQKKKTLYPKESYWISTNEILKLSFKIDEVHFSFFMKTDFCLDTPKE